MSIIYTYSGKKIDLLDPKPEDIDLLSIGNGLSRICRFNGQIDRHYSVLKHCMLMYEVAKASNESEEALKAILMHDASEAYIGDVVKPLKEALPEYQKIEDRLSKVIYDKYNIDFEGNKDIVHRYDVGALVYEKKHIRDICLKVDEEYEDFTDRVGIDTHNQYINNNYLSNGWFFGKFLHFASILGIKD